MTQANDAPMAGGSNPCPDEITVKENSPGLIEIDEWVIHLMFDPDNSTNGEYHPGKLDIRRLKRREFSVSRPRHSTSQRIRAHVVAPREGAGKVKFAGALVASVQAIRDILDDEQNRQICAYDDPDGEYVEHGLLGFSEFTRVPKYWENNKAAAALGNLSLVFEESGVGLPLSDCFAICGEEDA